MSDLPYMKAFCRDYLADTRHLSPEQHGFYWLMLLTAWQHEARLPNDEKKLARIVGVSVARWRKVSPDVVKLWTVTDCGQFIYQKRQLFEFNEANVDRAQKSAAGKESARRRALKNKEPASTPVAEPLEQESQQTANRTPAKKEPQSQADLLSDASHPQSPEATARPPRVLVKEAFDAYNAVAEALGLPIAKKLDVGKRREHLANRLVQVGGIEGWLGALAMIEHCPHLLGENDRGWKADLDFLLQPSKLQQLIEGRYTRTARPASKVRANCEGWIVTYGTEEFRAWRDEFQRQNSPRQWEFMDKEGCEVRVPSRWPDRRA